jgi:hypothetical protein
MNNVRVSKQTSGCLNSPRSTAYIWVKAKSSWRKESHVLLLNEGKMRKESHVVLFNEGKIHYCTMFHTGRSTSGSVI